MFFLFEVENLIVELLKNELDDALKGEGK